MQGEIKEEFYCGKKQTREQYVFIVYLTCPQQTDQMLWWCDEVGDRKLTY